MNEPDIVYRALVEQQPAVAYLDTPAGDPVYVSPQIERLLGVSVASWMHDVDSWVDVVHEDDRDRVLRSYKRALEVGTPYQDEYRIVRPDGTLRWVQDLAERVPTENGGWLVQGLITDVTDRKQAELEAAAGDRALRETFASLPLAAFLQAIDGTIIYCNARLAELLGRTQEELVGRVWGEIVTPRRSPDDEWAVALLRGEVIPYIETPVDSPNGGRRMFAWWCGPVYDGEGRVIAAASLGLDVTAHRDAQEALARSEERSRRVLSLILRAEEDERARIAGELHDDTVQVLTAALLALDRAGSSLRRSGHEREAGDIAVARATLLQATERARRLMFELRPQLLDAHGLEAAVRALLEQAGSEAGFATSLAAAVGRYPEGVEGMTYRTVREAVANARRHSRAHSLRVELSEQNGSIRGSVCDDGVGFDPDEARDRPDAYLHQGLTAVAERLRLAGGQFEIEAVRGGGTRVTFSVPIGVT
jgi:PAS domain S-box-containing protein